MELGSPVSDVSLQRCTFGAGVLYVVHRTLIEEIPEQKKPSMYLAPHPSLFSSSAVTSGEACYTGGGGLEITNDDTCLKVLNTLLGVMVTVSLLLSSSGLFSV
jgi:hypothetical protein